MMARAIPFVVAAFMLTPLLLWALLWAAGMRGAKSGFDGPEAVVLLLASLPLAGVFWVRNLREMGDSLGPASRLGLARLLTVLLPALILLIGTAGLFWLHGARGDPVSVGLVAAGVAAMAGFAAAAAAPGGERAAGRPTRSPGWAAGPVLLVIANLGMALALLAYYWTPAVLFWAAVGLVPVVFVAIVAFAHQRDEP